MQRQSSVDESGGHRLGAFRIVDEVSGSRLESTFSRVGLAATACGVLAVLVLLDVVLTSFGSSSPGASEDAFALQFVTRDGRVLGGKDGGAVVALSPLTLYENLPNQAGPKYRTNAYGLRGGAVARQASGPRVVVVGGSAAFGLRVPEDATFSAQLASRLSGVEVLNAGVSGYLSGQELALVATQLLELEPDVLVVFDGWNDVYDPYWWSRFGDGHRPHPGVNNGFRTLEDRLVRYREIQESPWAALQEAGNALVRRTTVLAALAGMLGSEPETRPSRGLGPAERAAIADRYVSNLRTLHGLARARGIEMLVVVQPELGQYLPAATRSRLTGQPSADFIDGDEYAVYFPELYEEFRGRVVPELRNAGIPVIDATAGFVGTAEPRNLFVDAVHLSPAGHGRIAEMLAKPVASRLQAGEPDASGLPSPSALHPERRGR